MRISNEKRGERAHLFSLIERADGEGPRRADAEAGVAKNDREGMLGSRVLEDVGCFPSVSLGANSLTNTHCFSTL